MFPFSWLFDSSGFVPRKDCGAWTPGLITLHLVSDVLIWLAYMTIPLALVYLARRRPDAPFRALFWLFGAFIVSCGLTHLIEAVLFVDPVYRLSGVVKAFTAVASWVAVVALVRILPQALRLRSPEQLAREVAARTADLAGANAALRDEVAERRRAEQALREEREKFRLILASIGDAVLATDADGRVTFLNDVAVALLGWGPGEALNRPVEEVFRILDEEGRLVISNPATRALHENRIVNLANRTLLLARDGAEHLIEHCAAPIPGPDRPAGAVLVFRDVGERRRAEFAHARLAALVESSEDAIVGKTLEGLITSWNAGAERLFGYTASEVLGRSISVLVPPDRPDEIPAILEGVRRGEPVQHFETVRVRKDGSRVDVSLCVSPIKTHGRIIGASKIARDVTARKQAEAALRESELRLRFALDATRIGEWDQDLKTGLTHRSQRHARIFGYEDARGEWSFDTFLRHVYPEDRDTVADLTRTGLASGAGWEYECRIVRTDGQSRDIWTKAIVSGVEGNQPVRITGLVMDVTERKQAEAALRLRDRAIQAVTQGILITDHGQSDEPIIFSSPGFQRITGYEQATVLGRNCRFLQGPRTDPEAVARLRQAILAEGPCSVEIVNYRKDGTTFWNALSIAPLRDEGGRVTHYVGVQDDMTERRRLEEQYRQAQKMEAVGVLAGGIAHDFNNLLTVIGGYGELLQTDLPAGDPRGSMVREMTRAGQRAAALTRQLLAFSRQQPIAPRLLDLNAIVDDLQKMLRRLIGEDIRLVVHLHPAPCPVKADPGQMEQVLMNLTINARDAMPRGGQLMLETRTLQVPAHALPTPTDARPGRYAVLVVSDTGSGMTPEVRERIFEPFFTTKEAGKGTGLGLAVVYGIVKQSGGFIEVNTEPARGTSFALHLPLADEADAPGPVLAPAPPPRGHETVLVVEDEEPVRVLIGLVLQTAGYTVLEASGGGEALHSAADHPGPIHLLVTDVVMPDIGGRELAEQLKARYPGLKVLYLSGYTDEALLRHGVQSDQVPFLQKPFSTDILAHKVRQVLDG